MNLYDVAENEETDWFSLCPNADSPMVAPKPKRLFDVLRTYTNEYDRVYVSECLKHMDGGIAYAINVLMRTFPNNIGIEMCAREFCYRIPNGLLCSILALSHNGVGRRYLNFPPKRQKPIPKSLMKAFGLRGSEMNWFHDLAQNEDFVRGIAHMIKKEDWQHIIHDKATLFKKDIERTTAPPKDTKQGAIF